MDDRGSAHLVTHAPFTRLGGEPGRPFTADVELQATGYDLASGHRLLLVLDTVDPFYGDANQPGTTLVFSADDTDPPYLDVPLG